MFVDYAIYNKLHDKVYIGQTSNLKERLIQHNNHVFKGYTSRFSGDWIVIYKETVNSRKNALIREKQLKSFRGREFIKKIIPR